MIELQFVGAAAGSARAVIAAPDVVADVGRDALTCGRGRVVVAVLAFADAVEPRCFALAAFPDHQGDLFAGHLRWRPIQGVNVAGRFGPPQDAVVVAAADQGDAAAVELGAEPLVAVLVETKPGPLRRDEGRVRAAL